MARRLLAYINWERERARESVVGGTCRLKVGAYNYKPNVGWDVEKALPRGQLSPKRAITPLSLHLANCTWTVRLAETRTEENESKHDCQPLKRPLGTGCQRGHAGQRQARAPFVKYSTGICPKINENWFVQIYR